MYNEIAVRDTRAYISSYLVSVPHAPLALFENSFAYRGPVIWNVLPEHVRKYNNLHTFKKSSTSTCDVVNNVCILVITVLTFS